MSAVISRKSITDSLILKMVASYSDPILIAEKVLEVWQAKQSQSSNYTTLFNLANKRLIVEEDVLITLSLILVGAKFFPQKELFTLLITRLVESYRAIDKLLDNDLLQLSLVSHARIWKFINENFGSVIEEYLEENLKHENYPNIGVTVNPILPRKDLQRFRYITDQRADLHTRIFINEAEALSMFERLESIVFIDPEEALSMSERAEAIDPETKDSRKPKTRKPKTRKPKTKLLQADDYPILPKECSEIGRNLYYDLVEIMQEKNILFSQLEQRDQIRIQNMVNYYCKESSRLEQLATTTNIFRSVIAEMI